jgi:hypothetical protein
VANWRDTTPHDLDLSSSPRSMKPARGPRFNWRPILFVVSGALAGLIVGEWRLRTYEAAVDTSFGAAQREVKRLTDERTNLSRQVGALEKKLIAQQKEAAGTASARKKEADDALAKVQNEKSELTNDKSRLETEVSRLEKELARLKPQKPEKQETPEKPEKPKVPPQPETDPKKRKIPPA